jgi:hypothetical protein
VPSLAPVYTVIFLNLDFDSLIINVIDRYTGEVVFFIVIFILLLMSVTVVLLLIGRREVR